MLSFDDASGGKTENLYPKAIYYILQCYSWQHRKNHRETAGGEPCRYESRATASKRSAGAAARRNIEIKNVKKLGAKTYTQAIGFLRVLDGDHPLDATAIHPENYQQALDLLNLCQLSLADLGTVELKDKLLKINKKEVIETLKIDQYTLDDIIDCLIKPNRSIRDQYQTPLLKKDILHIEDLKPGMVLEGTVRNVVDFGAFVDIGLKNDGLVHISKMSKQRIKHPLDVLSIGDIVEVNVIDVDLNKKRVSLSMI